VTRTTAAIEGEVSERRRYLYIRVPRCPECDSPELKPYKTIHHNDHTTTRYLRCLACGLRVIGVYE
jgi:DNA-directed RNA polymerase subunit RPC12/RpoP